MNRSGTRFDVAVIGQGYAGLCAARFSLARGLSVITFESMMVGGAVMTVLSLDPSPEDRTRSGPDLGAIVGMENIDAGAQTVLEPALSLEREASGDWQVTYPQGVVSARHVIIATGLRSRKLGVPGVDRLEGLGVSRCADCDGPDMIGRHCVVVGGGDSAFQEAAVLARVAASVKIVMRAKEPRARADLVDRACASDKISVLAQTRITQVIGEDRVEAVEIDRAPGQLLCEGLFVFAGGIPETSLVPAVVPRDGAGGLITDERGALPLSGLWAAGSVRAGFMGGLAEAREDARIVAAAL